MNGRGDRPNILLVMSDQLSALATSPYGNQDVITPHLSRLAERGITFENAYCNAPLCAPSRASMMTGQLPDAIPVNDNAEELPASVPTFAHHLRRSGYKTVLSGKMHFVGPDQLHGFEERLTTDIYVSDVQWTEDWDDLGVPPRAPNGAKFGRYMSHMIADSGPVPWSTQLDYDEETHFRALERIRQFARRSSDTGVETEPWFLCVSYTQPHDPYAPTQEYWDKYEGREIALPEPTPDDHEDTVWDSWVNSYHGVDIAAPTDDDVRRARRGYYAMTTYIDDKLGDLQRELDRLGELENTVVIFLSDHGDMVGENGMFFKRTFREWSSRIPLIFAGVGIPEGVREKSVVSLVDLFPTLLSVAGIEGEFDDFGYDYPGRDILARDAEGGIVSDKPGHVIIDYSGEGVISTTRTVVDGRFKYVYVHGEEELLFDLASDPKEWNNLVSSPEHLQTLDAMREKCLAGWNPDEAHRRIHASQQRRIFIDEALSEGLYTSWDYQPKFDATRMHFRRPLGQPWDRSYIKQFLPMQGGI